MDFNSTTSTPTSASSVNTSALDSQEEFLSYINKCLWWVLSPVLLLVGTSGNILSLITLHTKPFRGTGTSFALCALACVDIGILYFGLLVDSIEAVTDTKATIFLGNIGCKIHHFLKVTLIFTSSWTIVQVTIARALMVCYPFKAKRLCSRRNLARVWAIVVTVVIILTTRYFWTVKIRPEPTPTLNGTVYCKEWVSGPWGEFLAWKYFVVASVLPALFIIVTNAVIVYRLTVKPLKKEQASSPVRGSKAKRGWNSVSKMLVTVSVAFLVTTLPFAINVSVRGSLISPPNVIPTATEAKQKLTFTFTLLLQYSNSAINIFLYVLSGRSFRRALIGVLASRLCNQAQPSDPMTPT